MARKRDYAAEYAARQARAHSTGYKGYWQQRAARELELEQPGGKFRSREQRVYATKLSAADMRRGVRALKRKDFDEADRIARKAGVGKLRKKPRGVSDRDWRNRQAPRRVFYYH